MSMLAGFVRRRNYFLLSLAVFALDQAAKIGADSWLQGRTPVPLIPGFFNLSYSLNRGGLFGYGSGFSDPLRAVLLTMLPSIAILAIAIFIVRMEESDRVTLTGLALILGGAAGNLLDRVVRGEVVDFLDVYASWTPLKNWLVETFGTAHWPTFNVADSCIVIGAGLLFLDLVRPMRKPAVDEGTPATDSP